jgi:tRNA(Ser,Leu) C12 N-acetylase TAN1
MPKFLFQSFEAEIVPIGIVAVARTRTDVDTLSRRSDLMETRLDFLLVEQVVRIDCDGRKDL